MFYFRFSERTIFITPALAIGSDPLIEENGGKQYIDRMVAEALGSSMPCVRNPTLLVTTGILQPISKEGITMGHGHVTPNADGSRMRCGGPPFCAVCRRELDEQRRINTPQANWQLVTDARLVEIMRGYITTYSNETSRPDMNNESHLLALLHLALDEENSLRIGHGMVQKDTNALSRYLAAMEGAQPEPIEALRFYCSLAMKGKDWLDVEQFFDALTSSIAATEKIAINWRKFGMDKERRATVVNAENHMLIDHCKRIYSLLLQARDALRHANAQDDGPIKDTIWMISGAETLFDFMDTLIAIVELVVAPKEENKG